MSKAVGGDWHCPDRWTPNAQRLIEQRRTETGTSDREIDAEVAMTAKEVLACAMLKAMPGNIEQAIRKNGSLRLSVLGQVGDVLACFGSYSIFRSTDWYSIIDLGGTIVPLGLNFYLQSSNDPDRNETSMPISEFLYWHHRSNNAGEQRAFIMSAIAEWSGIDETELSEAMRLLLQYLWGRQYSTNNRLRPGP